jgi:diguanylate cyclase (GGDEF)-like protein
MFARYLRHPGIATAVGTLITTATSYLVSLEALSLAGLPMPAMALALCIGLPAIGTPLTIYPLLAMLRKQRQMRIELERLVHTDTLTDLPNRRAFFEFARPALSAEIVADKPLAAMMIDVDHFKRINDGYGHDIGDMVLRRVAGVIRDEVGSSGATNTIVARLGGEEFAVIVSGLAPSAVARLADRICSQVHRWVGAGDSLDPVTVSIGVAFRVPGKGIDRLLKAADDAVYAAKASGRDRWAFAGDAATNIPRRPVRPLPEPANDRVALG